MTKIFTRKPYELVEIGFDLLYLLFALASGGILLLLSGGSVAASLYGILVLTLGFGDAFHLVPRVLGLATGTMEARSRALGFGKLVTSVTMTVFYVMLYYVWQALYRPMPPVWLTVLVLALAGVRIVLCLLPGNGWFSETPSLRWAIARNLPFLLLGAVIVTLFFQNGTGAFTGMPYAVFLSFLFYIPVVLLAGKFPRTGALMLPKTLMYVWMICMGFSLL